MSSEARRRLNERRGETAQRANPAIPIPKPIEQVHQGQWKGKSQDTGEGIASVPGQGTVRGQIRTNSAMSGSVRVDLHNNSIDDRPAPPYPPPPPPEPKPVQNAGISFLMTVLGETNEALPCACLAEKLANRVYFLLVQEYVRTVQEGAVPCRSPIWVKWIGHTAIKRPGYFETLAPDRAFGEAYPNESQEIKRIICQRYCINDSANDVIDPTLLNNRAFYRTLKECVDGDPDNPPAPGTPGTGKEYPPPPDGKCRQVFVAVTGGWSYPTPIPVHTTPFVGEPAYKVGYVDGMPSGLYAWITNCSGVSWRIVQGSATRLGKDRYVNRVTEERGTIYGYVPYKLNIYANGYLWYSIVVNVAGGTIDLLQICFYGVEGSPCTELQDPPPPPPPDPDNPDPDENIPPVIEVVNTRRSLKFWIAGHQPEPEFVTEMCWTEHPIMGLTTDSKGNWVVLEKSGSNYPETDVEYINLINSGIRTAYDAFDDTGIYRIMKFNYIKTYPIETTDHPLYTYSKDDFSYGRYFSITNNSHSNIPSRPGAPAHQDVYGRIFYEEPPLDLYDSEMSIYRNTSYIESMCLAGDWSTFRNPQDQQYIENVVFNSGYRRFIATPDPIGYYVGVHIDFPGINLQKAIMQTQENETQEVKLISYLGLSIPGTINLADINIVRLPQAPFFNAVITGVIQSKDFALMNQPITAEIEYQWVFKDTLSPVSFRITKHNYDSATPWWGAHYDTQLYGLYYGDTTAVDRYNNPDFPKVYHPADLPHFGVRRRVPIEIYALGKPEWFDDPQYVRTGEYSHFNAYMSNEYYWELGEVNSIPVGTSHQSGSKKLPFRVVSHTTFVGTQSIAEAELEWENYLAEQEQEQGEGEQDG